MLSSTMMANDRTQVNRRTWLLVFAVVCFGLDQAIKFAVRANMTPGDSLPLIPGFLHATYVHNTGVAFSLFQQHPAVLLILTSLLFVVFLALALKPKTYAMAQLYGYALVLGGAAGNIADRLLFGKVVDYIDVVAIHYPVFNLADSFICVGVAMLLIHYWRGHHDGDADVSL